MWTDLFRSRISSGRDSSGQVMDNPPVFWDIESDPLFAGIKVIAEAWDAAGLYQVGSFIGDSWKEWNGRFRDDARSLFRSEEGSLARFADRLVGSPEIYGHKQREPEQSVNFVTCHDPGGRLCRTAAEPTPVPPILAGESVSGVEPTFRVAGSDG